MATIRAPCVAALLLVAPLVRGAEPPELLGRWVKEGEPEKVLELKAGGTGSIEGQPLTWSVDGTKLTITDPGGTDTTDWKVTGSRLVLTVGFGSELVFVRASDPPTPHRSRPPAR